MPPEVGDEMVLRVTEERVRVVAVLDAAGTLLVEALGEEGGAPFQVARDEVASLAERHRGCGCC